MPTNARTHGHTAAGMRQGSGTHRNLLLGCDGERQRLVVVGVVVRVGSHLRRLLHLADLHLDVGVGLARHRRRPQVAPRNDRDAERAEASGLHDSRGASAGRQGTGRRTTAAGTTATATAAAAGCQRTAIDSAEERARAVERAGERNREGRGGEGRGGEGVDVPRRSPWRRSSSHHHRRRYTGWPTRYTRRHTRPTRHHATRRRACQHTRVQSNSVSDRRVTTATRLSVAQLAEHATYRGRASFQGAFPADLCAHIRTGQHRPHEHRR
jgi:hypothetical protein